MIKLIYVQYMQIMCKQKAVVIPISRNLVEVGQNTNNKQLVQY